MKHYGMPQWVDFSRGLTPESDAAAMQAHAIDCEECRDTAAYCSKLARFCQGMQSDEVPAYVVRNAVSLFPGAVPARAKRSFRIPVELIYDSFLVPAPAGFRATWQVGWQALYHAGECTLDLRIEPELRTPRAAVIGQISNHETPDCRMADIPVCLKSGRLVVAETRSNEFGEFQMEYEQHNRLQLCVFLDGGSRCIQIPMKKFETEKPAAADRLKLGGTSSRKRQSTSRPR